MCYKNNKKRNSFSNRVAKCTSIRDSFEKSVTQCTINTSDDRVTNQEGPAVVVVAEQARYGGTVHARKNSAPNLRFGEGKRFDGHMRAR